MTSKGSAAHWQRKFSDAFAGLALACRHESSLWVHLAISTFVVLLAIWLRLESWRWCVLLICIAAVVSLELMNSAIERLVKTLHPEHDAGIASSLHMAAASVLVMAMGSVIVGLVVLLPALYARFANIPS